MLDVRRLRVLREVALRGSIAAAAESLRFTPSAVSQQLAKLELEAGVPLLERSPRSVRLTQAGWRLVEHAEVILEQLARAEADLRELDGSPPILRVGANTTAAASIVPEALTRFAAACPGIEVMVTEADPLVSLARVRVREAFQLKADDFEIAVGTSCPGFAPKEIVNHFDDGRGGGGGGSVGVQRRSAILPGYSVCCLDQS